jgi:hypothetical protein
MTESLVAYLLPIFPLLSFAILILVFRPTITQELPEGRRIPTTLRLLTIVLAAFSYAGLLGLAAISATIPLRFDLPIYYLLVGFLAYYVSVNVQAYQFRRWHEQLAMALLDVGSLSLILAALATIIAAPYPQGYRVILSLAAFLVWYLDHLVRVALSARGLSRAEGYGLAQYDPQGDDLIRRTAFGDALWYLMKGYKSE